MASKESIMIRQLLRQSVAAQKLGQTIEEARQGLETLMSMIPLAQDIKVEKLFIEGIPAEWVIAPNATNFSRDSTVLSLLFYRSASINLRGVTRQ